MGITINILPFTFGCIVRHGPVFQVTTSTDMIRCFIRDRSFSDQKAISTPPRFRRRRDDRTQKSKNARNLEQRILITLKINKNKASCDISLVWQNVHICTLWVFGMCLGTFICMYSYHKKQNLKGWSNLLLYVGCRSKLVWVLIIVCRWKLFFLKNTTTKNTIFRHIFRGKFPQ
jgi:hypothetical protein